MATSKLTGSQTTFRSQATSSTKATTTAVLPELPVNKQVDVLQANQAITSENQKHADEAVSESPNQQKEITAEEDRQLEQRTTSPVSLGIIVDKYRNDTEDNENQLQQQAIQESTSRVARLEQAGTYVQPRQKDDISRTTTRLQRRCNHSFSNITGRCIYCNKGRNAHV
jgi:hypothetical protein